MHKPIAPEGRIWWNSTTHLFFRKTNCTYTYTLKLSFYLCWYKRREQRRETNSCILLRPSICFTDIFYSKKPNQYCLDIVLVSLLSLCLLLSFRSSSMGGYRWKEGFSQMVVMCKIRSVLTLIGGVLNKAASFVVFCILDLLDIVMCFVYKVADFCIEAEWKPYACSSAKQDITGSGKILVSEQGESKIVCLTSSTKLRLEDISDTLYSRPSLVTEVSRLTVNELKKLKFDGTIKKGTARSTFTINSTIVEMLQGKMVGQHLHPIPRWSECDCEFCNSWASSCKDTLFVKAEGPKDKAREDVLFIHGFVSSSAFWTETLFPNFSSTAKSNYRLFAVDLLGFGRSPKPTDSLYTLREHVDMIEKSVLEPYKVKSFHIVAHSLGCILALAIAVKHPEAVKSLTLLAPPYYPVPKGEPATQYVMRRVAPRRVWPLMAFCASIACWYEHLSRTVSLVLCKHHRLWDFLIKLVTRNR
ncbi:hypothetical protein PTKIN_Ptkin04bG0165900 [Pterospermum kingtungense]